MAIALGSNLGDREGHLAYAVARLSGLLAGVRASSRHETLPVDVPGDQPPFLNAALTGRTSLAARDLLGLLQQIEQERGRSRPYVNAPRTLDLDLILYGQATMTEPGLVVPHPRFRQREFVLAPLAELAADWTDPVTGLDVAELLARLRQEPPAPRR